METIYRRPHDYDLEHEGDDEDVAFYVRLLEKWRPRRVMELASGSGRIKIPLARAAAASGVEIVGLEREASMLEAAYLKDAALSDKRTCLSFIEADMRDWRAVEPFDLVIVACSSLSHLLTLDEQIATWRCAYRNLRNGDRLVADLTMRNLATYALRATSRQLIGVGRKSPCDKSLVRQGLVTTMAAQVLIAHHRYDDEQRLDLDPRQADFLAEQGERSSVQSRPEQAVSARPHRRRRGGRA